MWCPGCFNFGILSAFNKMIQELNLDPKKVVAVSGIGCHAKIVDYLKTSSFYSIHGRTLPTGTGIKFVNPELTVFCFAGDGDQYDEGISHLVHACLRNPDIKLVVHNNEIFALTTGQATSTTPKGQITKTTPHGKVTDQLNPIALALSLRASFVARGVAWDIGHLTYLMKEAAKHKGFALIDVLQPCISLNNFFDKIKDKIYKLEDVGHNPYNFEEAWKRALETEKIPIGIFYKEEKPTFEEEMGISSPLLEENNFNLENALKEFE